ncbi:MAG: hypothetical protein IJP46_11565, partial [Prevotella sp.]|nr:hypothetical protein [Prevotella sp.]
QAETEEYMFTMDLTTQSQFKVVKSDGVSQTWYPDGMGNNYGENGEITQDGNYTIYFRPNADGGDDWFNGVIYVQLNGGEEPVEDEGLWITWGEDDLCDKGSAASQYGDSEDFYLTCVDSENSKLQVDANVAYFGTADAQKLFTHRLKTSGKSTSKNNLTLHIAKAGKLNVYVRAGNNEATDRKLVLTQGDTELYNAVVKDADAIQVAEADLNVSAPALDEVVYKSVYPVITVDVEEGDVLVGYPDNGLNFYGFQLIPDDGPITGIRNIEVTENPMFDESLPAYNLQGQRVTKSYRGVVIQNGRKFYNK